MMGHPVISRADKPNYREEVQHEITMMSMSRPLISDVYEPEYREG